MLSLAARRLHEPLSYCSLIVGKTSAAEDPMGHAHNPHLSSFRATIVRLGRWSTISIRLGRCLTIRWRSTVPVSRGLRRGRALGRIHWRRRTLKTWLPLRGLPIILWSLLRIRRILLLRWLFRLAWIAEIRASGWTSGIELGLCAWKSCWYIIISRRNSATTSAKTASISSLVNLLPWRVPCFVLASCSKEVACVAKEIAHVTRESTMTMTLGLLTWVHGVVLAMSHAI